MADSADKTPPSPTPTDTKVTINPSPVEIPTSAYDDVNTSFLSSVFGSDKPNIRQSSSTTHNRTLHRSTLSRSTVRYLKPTNNSSSEEDQEVQRTVMVTPLSQERAQVHDAGQRFLNNFRASAGDVAEESSEGEFRMYLMQAAKTSRMGRCQAFTSFLCAIINCGAATDSTPSMMNDRQNPNAWITNFFYWLFRKGWRTVFLISLLNFYILVLIFMALIVFWTTYVDADCVVVGGQPIGTLSKRSIWMDAFSLSWNTISTVGYGSTYPSLSTEHNHEGDSNCAFLSVLTSFEAFVGVIYAGFTGGVIFAKVTRLTQRARVKFSDPLLVKFGSGVSSGGSLDKSLIVNDSKGKSETNVDKETSEKDSTVEQTSPAPFPVLEFRLANELHSVAASEIIGSQVKAVVLIEAQQDGEEVGDALTKQIKMERLKRMRSRRRSSSTHPTTTDFSSHTNFSSHSTDDNPSLRSNQSIAASTRGASSPTSSVLDRTKHYFGNRKKKIDDHEPGSDLIVPRMIFATLDLDHSEHPFFKRLWTFRHTIDGKSPLLKSSARQRIMENGGVWPTEWNNAQGVRNAIRFNQIVVSFTGVCNINAADVYKQKVYDFVDLACGYQFVNPMYKSSSGKLKVDLDLMHDVVEQNGGGGESLDVLE